MVLVFTLYVRSQPYTPSDLLLFELFAHASLAEIYLFFSLFLFVFAATTSRYLIDDRKGSPRASSKEQFPFFMARKTGGREEFDLEKEGTPVFDERSADDVCDFTFSLIEQVAPQTRARAANLSVPTWGRSDRRGSTRQGRSSVSRSHARVYARESGPAGMIVATVLFGRRAPFSTSFPFTSARWPSKSRDATSSFCRLTSFFSRSIWRNDE